jgi:Predicted membrane protein (DUF2231)
VFDTFLGLPIHALVLHAVVIGVPVTALITAVVSARAPWRERWAGWVALLNGAMLIVTYVTRESGKELFKRLDSLGAADVARSHRDWGLFLIWPMLALFVLSVLIWLATRQAAGAPVMTVLSILTLIAAGFVTYWTVRTGHSGSEAVWKDIVRSTNSG